MQAVKKDGVPRGAVPVVLMRILAVGNTYTTMNYDQGGKLEGSEISEKGSEKEVESVKAVKKDGVPRGAFLAVLMRILAVGNTYTIMIYVRGGKLEGSEVSEKGSEKEVESVKAVKKDGVPEGAFPVVLMRILAVGNTHTIMIYVQGGKLEGSEISGKGSEKEVEAVKAVKKDGVPRGAFPAVLMRNLAVGITYTIIIYVQGGKLEGSEISQRILKKK